MTGLAVCEIVFKGIRDSSGPKLIVVEYIIELRPIKVDYGKFRSV